MSEKRRGLGKGLGALIPSAPTNGRPVDVFFPEQRPSERAARGGYVASEGAATSEGSAGTQQREWPTEGTHPAAPATTVAPGATGRARRPASKRAQIPADTLAPRRRSTSPSVRTDPTEGTSTPSGADADITPSVLAADGQDAQAPGTTGRGDEGPHETGADTDDHAQRTKGADDDGAPTSDGARGVPEATTPDPESGEQPAHAGDDGRATASTDADDGLVAVPGATFAEIPVGAVVANRRQPRQVFDEDELDELAASIREVGVLQPIVVRPLPDGDGYELIMGERRWRASELAGSTTVPAIIRQVDDNDLLRDALLENLHRAQLNPLEEAAAYQQLLEDFGCTHEELATRIARSRPQISNTLRLLKLPPLVQRRLAAGVLSSGHARALLGLADAGAMERLAQRIVAEGLSVRSTEEIVALGDEPIEPEMRRRPRTGEHSAELNEIATKLADRFDTRVKIGMGQRKGRINIEFAGVDDLNRILDVLAPSLDGVAADATGN